MQPGSWQECTYIAWENQGGICPICGRRIYLTAEKIADKMVGHHVQPRALKGENTVENCVARHAQPCESWSHKVHPTGNPTPEQIMKFREQFFD